MAWVLRPAANPSARHGSEIKTLGGAGREFWRYRSPRIIASAIAVVATLRAVHGEFGWGDAIAFAGMVAAYPFGEWAIHVYLLHLRPFRFRGRMVELATSKAHREHHERPSRLGLILLGPLEAAGLLLLTVPFTLGLGIGVVALAGGHVPLGPVLTGLLTGYLSVGIYEWTHFLIHTAYRPRSRYYRSIWRNHRLHHFKNEHYWHGIVTTVGDRALGTLRDHRDVPRSPTARTLDPGPAAESTV
jgi:fatty acid hydroxylase family protein